MSSSKKSDDVDVTTYLRYLKPGALAKLRDSRISTRRSHRIDLKINVSPVRTPNLPTSEPNHNDGFLCFTGTGRINGPRFPQRKKLTGARSFFFMDSSPLTDSSDSVIVDAGFGNDILANCNAH